MLKEYKITEIEELKIHGRTTKCSDSVALFHHITQFSWIMAFCDSV